jgi:hypothetical protein
VTARGELDAVGEFDFVVVNDDLDRAVQEVRAAVEGDGSGPSGPAKQEEKVAALRQALDAFLRDELGDDIDNRS